MNHQSPINFSPTEMTVYEPGFNGELKYNTAENLACENILWTVRLQG